MIEIHDVRDDRGYAARLSILLEEYEPDGNEIEPALHLEWLRRLSLWLEARRGWEPARAALWVLTGELPPVDLLKAVVHHADPASRFSERIEIVVDPIVHPREVLRLYRQARRALGGKDSRLRKQSAKHLRLARFADLRSEERPREPWNVSMETWSEENPEDAFTKVDTFTALAQRAPKKFLASRPFFRVGWQEPEDLEVQAENLRRANERLGSE